MENSKAVKDAIQAVYEDIQAMSKETFLAELEKHKPGDIAKILIETGSLSGRESLNNECYSPYSLEFENMGKWIVSKVFSQIKDSEFLKSFYTVHKKRPCQILSCGSLNNWIPTKSTTNITDLIIPEDSIESAKKVIIRTNKPKSKTYFEMSKGIETHQLNLVSSDDYNTYGVAA